MALQDLATEEMVMVTGFWLDPEHQRPILERLARVAPLLVDIANAHSKVVVFQNAGKQESPELAELSAKTTALDAEHDRLTRGIHLLLLGLIETSDDPTLISRLSALYAELLPRGLGINQQSYLVEAGDVTLRHQRLSTESKKLLAASLLRISGCNETSLGDLVSRWDRAATELGETEAKKIRVKGVAVSESSRGPARRAWIRIVAFVLQALEMETSLTDAERRALLEPLRNAEARAAKRRAAAKKKNIPFDPDSLEPDGESAKPQ